MKRALLVAGITIMSGYFVFAQNGLFEDTSGEGAVKINANRFSLNAGESAIKFDYFNGRSTTPLIQTWAQGANQPAAPNNYTLWKQDVQIDPNGDTVNRAIYFPDSGSSWGFNVNAKANNGISNVVKSGKLDPAGTVGLYWTGFLPSSAINRIHYINLYGSIESGNVTLLDTGDITSGSFQQNYVGFRFEIAYNRYGELSNSTTVFGVSTTLGQQNNSGSLSSIDFQNTTTLSTTGNQTLTRQNTISGINKDQFLDNQSFFKLNADWGIYPRFLENLVLLAAHWRSKSILNSDNEQESKLITNLGLGAYIVKDGAPSNIIGGVNLLVDDVFTVANNDSVNKRISINLVAGFKF